MNEEEIRIDERNKIIEWIKSNYTDRFSLDIDPEILINELESGIYSRKANNGTD